VPALADLRLEIRGDVLAFEVADVENVPLALALREHLIEAFRIPSSSMVPTLQIGDHIFAVKGPLARTPAPGDVYVYRTHDDHDFIFRFITGGPHTVTESEDGIAIDGKLLPRTVVDSNATYHDQDGDGTTYERAGSIIREQAGARSYATFRMDVPRRTGPWFVPAGSAFFLGDNRNNANDSRFNPLVTLERLKGRAVVIWWAARDGIPQWDRIGLPIE
jgi:signal peptidase I